MFNTLEPEGIDLMKKLFIYDPARRLSVRRSRNLVCSPIPVSPDKRCGSTRPARTRGPTARALGCLPAICWLSHRTVRTSAAARHASQAKDAIVHPYFDDLDKATVDLLESDVIRARDG